jgi:hypothetical protein
MRRLTLFLLLITALSAFSERDPFWPIGYTPASSRPEPDEETPDPDAPETRELTDEELRRLAEQEAEKIKEILDRKATAVFGGKVHALINGNWVSQGDSLTVEVLGNSYRLQIITLTTENIELQPHRTRSRGIQTP